MHRAVLPDMGERRSSLLGHISSIAGRMVFPFSSQDYASEAAVEALAESYRQDLVALLRALSYGRTTSMLHGHEHPTTAMQIAKAFRRHGVEVTFGQSLPSAFHLAASKLGIRQIGYRQENAGGAMADGHARISHKVAVVTAQNGPAATMLVPPLAEAYKASVPIVALVQEVDRGTTDKNAFQEFDQQRLFEPCAKWVVALTSRRVSTTTSMWLSPSQRRGDPVPWCCSSPSTFSTNRLLHRPIAPRRWAAFL
jgi:hypothetical protein